MTLHNNYAMTPPDQRDMGKQKETVQKALETMLVSLPADTPPDDHPKDDTTPYKKEGQTAKAEAGMNIGHSNVAAEEKKAPKKAQNYNQRMGFQSSDPTPAEIAAHANVPADVLADMNPAETSSAVANGHGAHHPQDVKYKGYAKDHKGMAKSHTGRDSHH